MRKHGAVKPIRHYRPPRTGTVKLSGLTVTRDCADKVNRYAKDSGLTVNAAATNIIEQWVAAEAQIAAQKRTDNPSGMVPVGTGESSAGELVGASDDGAEEASSDSAGEPGESDGTSGNGADEASKKHSREAGKASGKFTHRDLFANMPPAPAACGSGAGHAKGWSSTEMLKQCVTREGAPLRDSWG
jgi:hypothetical protein